ncbi:MAG: crossover junction endodeoxyribonuclease RuvC [Patescibacteria group bacterium]
MILLGIDPGLATTGYGFIKKTSKNLEVLDYGVISTPAKTDIPFRLKILSSDLKILLTKYKPEAVMVEKLFFCNNAKTALDVGQCRGVILLEMINKNIPVYEFTPLQVKQAVTGYGAATKLQIQKMVRTILKLKKLPKPDDAADALAMAIALANSIHSLNKKPVT